MADLVSVPDPNDQSDRAKAFRDAMAGDWKLALFRRGKSGRIEDRWENIFLILTNHEEWKDVIALDAFSNQIIKRKPAPFGGELGPWTDSEDLELGLWLAQAAEFRMCLRGPQTIAYAVKMAARRNSHHPVREYFAGLKWDETPRLDDWISDYLGAKKTEYTSLVGRFFFLGIVARVLEPGPKCIMRGVLSLHGKQEAGKSTALRIIGSPWFSDTPFIVGDKDSFLSLRGNLLYEISEWDAFSRADNARVKSFISSTEDTYRAPYDRDAKKWPRQCVFAGTTNQHIFLKDLTGATRHWPIKIGDIELDSLEAAKDQLFAEAVVLHKQGARRYPTREQNHDLFIPEQEASQVEDPWLSQIAYFLVGKRLVTMGQILTDALKIDMGKIDHAHQMTIRVGFALKKLGWERKREPDGQRAWFYEFVGDVE
jgi:putative DNA primase/helicase